MTKNEQAKDLGMPRAEPVMSNREADAWNEGYRLLVKRANSLDPPVNDEAARQDFLMGFVAGRTWPSEEQRQGVGGSKRGRIGR